MLCMQRMVQAMGFWLMTGLTTAGLPCTVELDSVIAIAGETLEDQVPSGTGSHLFPPLLCSMPSAS